jgi:hypothetical protein
LFRLQFSLQFFHGGLLVVLVARAGGDRHLLLGAGHGDAVDLHTAAAGAEDSPNSKRGCDSPIVKHYSSTRNLCFVTGVNFVTYLRQQLAN